ncbi:unnamed protein product [Rhizoctonia solani]|uniref:CHAT domain-containing protein n=1 Tax=Rhizoctonia solani TaxID=456999 RepID=A0A8H3BEW6_9AGAM|nr:unnamed protein product [Rhizoctonia solani]
MLADQLAQVSKNLHDAGSFITEITDYPHTTEQAAQKRRRLAEEYEKIMAEIRQTSGFENFLRPKKFFELLPAARKGPVAVINIERSRCDALVIKPGSTEISLVPLPDISYDQTVELRRKTEQSLEEMCFRERSSYRRPVMSDPEENLQNQELQLVLSTIWMCVAKPVLDSLEYRPTLSMDTIPHITWCTTGPLSSLPIHAAGNYDKAGAKIFECVVSSYTPTLSAIISESESGPRATSSILGIAQENTPGQNPLPGTINELALIAGHVEAPISYSQLTGSSATTLATLDAMEQYNWVHLACHANQNSIEPTESGFFLHDGTLSLARIVQRQFKGKGLAFLSACQTATGDRLLADESIHLASGMLMAGYPSIIATSWSIVDSDAPLIADVVYKILLKEGMMNHKDAAKALHVAVQKLRDIVGEKAFWRWAPYIHIGT